MYTVLQLVVRMFFTNETFCMIGIEVMRFCYISIISESFGGSRSCVHALRVPSANFDALCPNTLFCAKMKVILE